jgi:hypothetical protein
MIPIKKYKEPFKTFSRLAVEAVVAVAVVVLDDLAVPSAGTDTDVLNIAPSIRYHWPVM